MKIIKQKLNRFNTIVLWTGNGHHTDMILDIRPLELIPDLKELSDKPSERFLRYVENVFTNNKRDNNHKPSFKSCL